jgi:hypothetical protein
MIKKLLFIIAISAMFTQHSVAQWALGDIVFTGYQADGTGNPSGEDDEFSFVLLRDVASGESISFTDNGWMAAGGLRTGEGTITLQFTSAYLCGSQISIHKNSVNALDSTGGTAGSITGTAMSFIASGDQILAYDSGNVPTSNANQSGFIAAIQMNGDWDPDSTSSTTSAKPSIFDTLANSSIAITNEVDNAIYNCSVTAGNPAMLRAAIHNQANWNVHNDNPFDQPAPCTFTSCNTLSNQEFTLDNLFSVSPNPSNGLITIGNSGVALNKVQITDLNGRTVANYDFNSTTDNQELNLGSILSSGMYLMTISSENASTVKKIVIK